RRRAGHWAHQGRAPDGPQLPQRARRRPHQRRARRRRVQLRSAPALARAAFACLDANAACSPNVSPKRLKNAPRWFFTDDPLEAAASLKAEAVAFQAAFPAHQQRCLDLAAVAQVRNVGSYRVTGEKPDNYAKRSCADGERNLLLCHGNRKPLSPIPDFIPRGGHYCGKRGTGTPCSRAPRLTAPAKAAAAFRTRSKEERPTRVPQGPRRRRW